MKQKASILMAITVSGCLSFPASVSAQAMEEVVVTVDYIPDEKLQTSEVADILDAEDMSIAGDSNIGESLKRLPGLSLVGGKFVYVRGLGERYSSTYFNGTPIPSPEPLQRAVPLDLFDSSIISNVLVQKTYSPNYGAEFSGGVIDIRSAALPDENFFKLKFGNGFNDVSTNQNGFTYTGSGRDFWGEDNGSRAFPSFIKSNIGSYSNPGLFTNPALIAPNGTVIFEGSPLTAIAQDTARLSFNNNVWDARRRQNPYDISMSSAFGRRWDVDDKSFGLLVLASHDNQWRNRFTERNRWGERAFRMGLSDQQAENIREQAVLSGSLGTDEIPLFSVENYDRTINTINTSVMVSFGVEYGTSSSLKLSKLITRKTTDEASQRIYRIDEGVLNNGRDLVQETRLQWTENELDFNQVSGEHVFVFTGSEVEMKWRYSDIGATRDTPDSKLHALGILSGSTSNKFDLGIARSRQGVGDLVPRREFAFLDDDNQEFGVDFSVPFVGQHFDLLTLKFGASSLEKKRGFESFRFSYNFDSIAPGDPLFLQSLERLLDPFACAGLEGVASSAADDCYLATNTTGVNTPLGHIGIRDGVTLGAPRPEAYDGKTKLAAHYIALDLELSQYFRLNLGWRQERSLQQVLDAKTGLLLQDDGGIGTDNSPELNQLFELPSASFTWSFYDNMQLRGSFSQTINRPILRELAAVRIFNPEDGRFYIGNSQLKVAEIANRDLRYEWYFADDDYLSVSAFTKSIRNPVELFELGGETPEFTWQNNASADNEGYEFEIRKYLGQYWFLTANATHLNSSVQLSDATSTTSTAIQNGRPLQGLSKELFNAQVVYETETITASLAFNRFSKRIALINQEGGTVAGVPDLNRILVYEEPFVGVDFNLKLRVPAEDSLIVLSFNVKNLLDEETELRHGNGLVYDHYKIGRSAGLSVEWQHY